jgi:hypothetical protein
LADFKVLLHEDAELREVFIRPEVRILSILFGTAIKVLLLVLQVVASSTVEILLPKF